MIYKYSLFNLTESDDALRKLKKYQRCDYQLNRKKKVEMIATTLLAIHRPYLNRVQITYCQNQRTSTYITLPTPLPRIRETYTYRNKLIKYLSLENFYTNN